MTTTPAAPDARLNAALRAAGDEALALLTTCRPGLTIDPTRSTITTCTVATWDSGEHSGTVAVQAGWDAGVDVIGVDAATADRLCAVYFEDTEHQHHDDGRDGNPDPDSVRYLAPGAYELRQFDDHPAADLTVRPDGRYDLSFTERSISGAAALLACLDRPEGEPPTSCVCDRTGLCICCCDDAPSCPTCDRCPCACSCTASTQQPQPAAAFRETITRHGPAQRPQSKPLTEPAARGLVVQAAYWNFGIELYSNGRIALSRLDRKGAPALTAAIEPAAPLRRSANAAADLRQIIDSSETGCRVDRFGRPRIALRATIIGPKQTAVLLERGLIATTGEADAPVEVTFLGHLLLALHEHDTTTVSSTTGHVTVTCSCGWATAGSSTVLAHTAARAHRGARLAAAITR
ncbi:hypothetical protein [Kitasatospora sp. NPDC094016]|uniref:hypothetical protein n=1 Tax=Kitasatospora sp. NPDC094016 TaxID=3154986 RepID=UPI00331F7215